MTRTRIVLLALFALALGAACHSFTDSGEPRRAVRGVVYDAATREPVANVRIEVAGRIAATAANGSYVIADVPKGMQALTASKDGYATYATDVRVSADTNEKKFYLQPM